MLFSLPTYLLLASSSAVVSALVPTPSPVGPAKPPVKPSDVLYYDNGQCGGVGYKGKTDCKANFNPETPFDNYFCVVVTKDYWTCSLDTFYSACPTPAKGPKKGEICALNGEGPNCCANYPNEQCILLNDDALTSRCFEVKNPPPPPGTSATPTPTPLPCRPNWAQCGGIGWTGATCCADDPKWTCFRQNDWNSQCLPNTSLPSVTSTTSSTSRVSTKTSTSATPTPTTCQVSGKLCGAPGWTGPTCCQNAPDVACIPYYNGLSYCFELSHCTPHWGQCGGLNFQGPFCCLDEPNWFCEYENPYFSNCHPNPNVTATTTKN